MTEQTSLAKYDSGLDKEQHNAIAIRYNSATDGLKEALEDAKAIEVRDASDKEAMKKARDARLRLRQIRIEVEKTRKALKENALRESKAIDGMANVIKYMIEPVEQDLQEKEDFAKRLEEERIRRVTAERQTELAKFGIDTSCFDLGIMTAEAFEELRRTSEAGYKARIEEEERERQRIEEQRKAEAEEAAKREAERKAEEDRIRAENERLRKAAEEAEAERKKAEAKAEAERKKAEEARRKAEAEAEEERRRREAEERKRRDEEAARIKAEREAEQARLSAPDRDKIAAFVDEVCALTIPNVSGDVALSLFEGVRATLNGVVRDCRAAIKTISKATETN